MGWAAAGALAEGAFAGACAAADVSEAAAKAIAHPMYFISTPVACWDRKRRAAPPEVVRPIGRAFGSLKRVMDMRMDGG